MGLAALGLVALTARRPAVGCAVFAFLVALTTGLGRDTVVPLLRPNEALLLILLAGLAIHHLPRARTWPVSGLDLAVAGFCAGVVVIGLSVLVLTGSPYLRDTDTLRSVLSPIQLLVVYLVFSRVELTGKDVQALLNITMLSSVLVGLVAVAELADLPGVRYFLHTYFPPPHPVSPSWDPGYRPLSTLGHYSAVGAFGAMNYTLALALATTRHPAFPRAWLSVVMAVNVAAVVASLTWAPLIALPLVTCVVLIYGRRVPMELAVTVAALAIAFVLLWPAVSGRGAVQGVLPAGSQQLVVPSTFQYRLQVWNAFFVPALLDDVWLGTGTVIPSVVPTPLVNFVDNEYLREGFRAGVVGLSLLALMMATIAVVGWRSRASPDPTRHSLGGALVAMVLFFAVIGFTAEYLFFGGVSQEFAMLVGILGARSLVRAPVAGVLSARQVQRPAARPAPSLQRATGEQ